MQETSNIQLPKRSPIYIRKKGVRMMDAFYDQLVASYQFPLESHLLPTTPGPTHVLIGGERHKPPVLLLHAWGEQAPIAGLHFPYLFNSHRVFMIDILGQGGKSAAIRLPSGGPAYAGWLSDVMDWLGLSKAGLCGYSEGGYLALKLAAYYPEKVSWLVASSPSAMVPINYFKLFLHYSNISSIIPSDRTADWLISFLATPNFKTGITRDMLKQSIIHARKYLKKQKEPAPLTPAELTSIKVPTMILMGEKDRLISNKALRRRAEIMPGLKQVVRVPEAGHIPTIEQPEKVSNFIYPFIKGIIT